MKETQRIADQLKRAYQGEAWHGPSLRQLLSDVTWQAASKRPIAGAHTIWELVLHISAWEQTVRRRLASDSPITLAPEQDWPPTGETSEVAWESALAQLERHHFALRQAIVDLPDERLADTVPGREYSVYDMLHGVIQHDLYHAGQIAILKKTA